jgi:hypothetical protein
MRHPLSALNPWRLQWHRNDMVEIKMPRSLKRTGHFAGQGDPGRRLDGLARLRLGFTFR